MSSYTQQQAKPKTNGRYNILGVYVDALTMEQAAILIVQAAINKEAATYVCKPYVEFFTRAKDDPQLATLLNASQLCLPDGVSTQWAATFLASHNPSVWNALKLAADIIFRPHMIQQLISEKFGGATFSWKLLEHCARSGCSVYLVGSPSGGSIVATAATIQSRIPTLKIAGTWPGKLGGLTGGILETALESYPVEAELVHELRREQPDIILVGMGFPLQEKLMAKVAPQLRHGVLIGEGGTFDYDSFGGSKRRAPAWMRRAGLEWAWRLLLEPSRLGRQLAIPRFMYAVLQQARQQSK